MFFSGNIRCQGTKSCSLVGDGTSLSSKGLVDLGRTTFLCCPLFIIVYGMYVSAYVFVLIWQSSFLIREGFCSACSLLVCGVLSGSSVLFASEMSVTPSPPLSCMYMCTIKHRWRDLPLQHLHLSNKNWLELLGALSLFKYNNLNQKWF